jgi:transcription antitermination factor NusG
MQLASNEREKLQGQLAINWYAAYVKHQHEKKAADLLHRKGVEVFLPQQKVIHRWKDRNKTLFLPLFPGYLFLHCNLQDKFQILNTPGVFFLVENGGRACPIPKQEIDSIRRVTESGVEAQPHPFVSAGDRVRICSGPLSGVVGILTRFKNQHRVVLTVELLQKAVSIEVELANVELTEDCKRNYGSVTAELRKTA